MLFLKQLLISLFILVLIYQTTNAIVCLPDSCHTVKCPSYSECPEGEVLVTGGFCNCCRECHKILKEGDTCSTLLQHIRNPQPPKVHCDEGLICVDNVCKKINIKEYS